MGPIDSAGLQMNIAGKINTRSVWTFGRQRSKFTSMTIRAALKDSRVSLKGHETETPELDSALLLSHVLGIGREKLYMELAAPLAQARRREFEEALSRRIAGEPVAWITGVKEFWGIPLAVGPGVLCPRPDSETVVEAVLEQADRFPSPGRLHDCCTGPGTLALALAAERPEWSISASDICPEAERFFDRNNRIHAGDRVAYTRCDLMESVPGPFELIVSNPPYLTPEETGKRKALGWQEPARALNGGDGDGLGIIRRLIPQIARRLNHRGVVVLEAAPLQMASIGKILWDNGFGAIGTRRDLGGRERVIHGRKEGL